MIEDPRFALIRAALEARVPAARDDGGAEREAAVALVLRAGTEIELLMIRRSERADDPWSGHMALPGGGRHAEDGDLLDTALRETLEEVGIRIGRDAVLGALDAVHPRSARLPSVSVAPFVVVTDPDVVAAPDPREVQTAVWVPLSALRDPTAVSELVLELGDFTRKFPSIVYGEYTIWGLTHVILSQFLEAVHDAGVY